MSEIVKKIKKKASLDKKIRIERERERDFILFLKNEEETGMKGLMFVLLKIR